MDCDRAFFHRGAVDPFAIENPLEHFTHACSGTVLYPVLVVLFDWLLRSDRNQALLRRLTKLVRENWPVYVGLIFTGIAYLVLRT